MNTVPTQALPLAGYLLARGLDHKHLDQEGIKRLSLVDEAVNRARATFPFGRGNVDADVRASFESLVRASAVRTMMMEKLNADTQVRDDANQNFYALCAMTGKVFGAGVCDNYAPTAAFFYGAKAKDLARPPGEEVDMTMHKSKKHVWAEVRTLGGDDSIAVMDPWADGPAVLAEDSRFASRPKQLSTNSSFSLDDAADLCDWSDAESQSLRAKEEDIATRINIARDEIKHMSGSPFKLWKPQPVLRDEFLARASGHLETSDPWAIVQIEAQAAGIARSLGVEGVANLVTEAPKVVQSAKDLVEPGSGSGTARR